SPGNPQFIVASEFGTYTRQGGCRRCAIGGIRKVVYRFICEGRKPPVCSWNGHMEACFGGTLSFDETTATFEQFGGIVSHAAALFIEFAAFIGQLPAGVDQTFAADARLLADDTPGVPP